MGVCVRHTILSSRVPFLIMVFPWRFFSLLLTILSVGLWVTMHMALQPEHNAADAERAARFETIVATLQTQFDEAVNRNKEISQRLHTSETRVQELEQVIEKERAASSLAAAAMQAQDLAAAPKKTQDLETARKEEVTAELPISKDVSESANLRGGAHQEITEGTLRTVAASGAVPVCVIVCKRPKYLERAMDKLFKAPRKPEHFPLILSQDAHDQAMTDHIHTQYVRTGIAFHMHHDHDPNAANIARKFGGSKMTMGYVRIAQHYGWALRRVLDDFGFDQVIFLEEDLEISPDFFSYFDTMLPILKQDKDLYCVSAWNDNGMETLVKDPKAVYRTDSFPGLGWMMTKSFYNEVRNRWPDAYWDEFMRRPDVRKGRHCIRPEVSRTYTFGEEGTSAGQFFGSHLAKIKLNEVPVDWARQDLGFLKTVSAFDRYLSGKLQAASAVSAQDLRKYANQDKSFRFKYVEPHGYQRIAKQFGLMEDEKEGIRRMAYKGVIPFYFDGNRVYLHTDQWPEGSLV